MQTELDMQLDKVNKQLDKHFFKQILMKTDLFETLAEAFRPQIKQENDCECGGHFELVEEIAKRTYYESDTDYSEFAVICEVYMCNLCGEIKYKKL
jgi:hypothetical protein